MKTAGPLACMALVLATSLNSGCATVTRGTNQTITVSSDPAGAACTLGRSGTTIGVVNPTPGSVLVDRSSADISVICRRQGYIDSADSVAATFQAMTVGNLLIGGVIGVAIDAASGAMHEYPSLLNVILTPELFESIEARDRHFEKLRNKVDADFRERGNVLQRNGPCQANATTPEVCQQQLAQLESARKERLAELDGQRSRAKVR